MTNDPGAGAYKVPYSLASYDLQGRWQGDVNERCYRYAADGKLVSLPAQKKPPDDRGDPMVRCDDANTAVLTPCMPLSPLSLSATAVVNGEHDADELDSYLL